MRCLIINEDITDEVCAGIQAECYKKRMGKSCLKSLSELLVGM